MRRTKSYVLLFALGVCLVCAVLVATSATGLSKRQEVNRQLDRQKKILSVAGVLPDGATWSAQQVHDAYDAHIVPQLIDLKTGEVLKDGDPAAFNQRAAARDPRTSSRAPPNAAKVARLPGRALVFQQVEAGRVVKVILPVEGKGLWSTLYGYLALSADLKTIEGLTFYEHGETPGLGGEVENPRWLASWKGRRPFAADGTPVIEVAKGPAGSVEVSPTRVDGLSGATITGRGVTHLLRFWLGEQGYGPYLARLKGQGA